MKKILFIILIFCQSLSGQTLDNIYKIKKHLTSSDILTGFSSPIDVGLPLPGTGKAYEVVSVSVQFNYGTTTFTAGDGSFYIHTENLSIINYQAATTSLINFPFSSFARAAVNALAIQLIENKRLFITIGDDSSVGDGDADVYIDYRIINENGNTASPILDTIITLTSPQILSIGTTPVTLITSPGANKTIEIVSITDKLIFNTTAYTGHQTLVVKTATANSIHVTCSVLNQTANCKHHAVVTAPGTLTQIIPNQALIATTESGNPTTGDGSIQLHIYYRIVDY